MPIARLDHLVTTVADIDATTSSYLAVLGCRSELCDRLDAVTADLAVQGVAIGAGPLRSAGLRDPDPDLEEIAANRRNRPGARPVDGGDDRP